jgi:hypothetical protein
MISDLDEHEQLEYFDDDLNEMDASNSKVCVKFDGYFLKEFVYNLTNP